MKNFIKIGPISKIDGTIYLPGSKSISNRALLLAAQANGTTKLTNILDSDDVRIMLHALRSLGIKYQLSNYRKTCIIHGIGGPLQINTNDQLNLSLGNAGTAIRPLIAALSIKPNNIVLTGDVRMQERPISHLIDALKQGSSRIEYIERHNHLPVKLYGGYRGGNITVKGNISSQFLSSILMMTPLAPHNTLITIEGVLVSKPYIDITLSIMKAFGINIKHKYYQTFYCEGNRVYTAPQEYAIEGDASSASYFLAAAAIKGGTIQVLGINQNSIQGDIYFANILENMGAIINWGKNYIECTRSTTLNSVDIDVNNIPDAAMTLATTALFTTNNRPMVLRNIYNWRIKESDRLTAMATELKKVGAKVIEGYDFLHIISPKQIKSAYINTYNDHRIAMCFALAALSTVSIVIDNPDCTNKTFPNFFDQLINVSKL